MDLKVIGLVRSPFKDKFGTPRQSQIAKSTQSRIVFDKKIAPAEMLEGLEAGSYIWVLFWFHLNKQKNKITKVHPPRLRGKTLGVLATRTPHRPNPIGLSLGKVVEVKGAEVIVEGLDLVDKTPVVDIKPFVPGFDQPQDIPTSWTNENPFPQLTVKFERGLFGDLALAEKTKLKTSLTEILTEDPRPLAYLNKPEHTYWVKYDQYDIGFEIVNETLTVKEIKVLKAKRNL